MNATFQVEALHASFDNPHHVLVVGMAGVGVSDEPGVQHIGQARSLGREEPGPLGRCNRWRVHRGVT